MSRLLITALLGIVVTIAIAAENAARPASPLPLPTGTGRGKIALGYTHGVVLATDGSLWTWGENSLGWPVLGLGNVETQKVLHCLAGDEKFTDISVSRSHCLAVHEDGTIWGWGQNLSAQLGTGRGGRANSAKSTPAPTAFDDDWHRVAAGGSHSLALKRDGSLWAWGNNWAGQLGVGLTNKQVAEITRVGASTNWARIWASGIQSVGLQSDGSLWFWGSLTGESKDTNYYILPTRVSPDTNWTDVAFGYFNVLALKRDGTVWAWGRHAGIYTERPMQLLNAVPARVGTENDWVAISGAGDFHHLLQKRDGTLWLLDATEHAIVSRADKSIHWTRMNVPKPFITFAASGSRKPMGTILTASGEVWTWGKVLGEYEPGKSPSTSFTVNGTHVRSSDPVPVIRPEPWQLGREP